MRKYVPVIFISRIMSIRSVHAQVIIDSGLLRQRQMSAKTASISTAEQLTTPETRLNKVDLCFCFGGLLSWWAGKDIISDNGNRHNLYT